MDSLWAGGLVYLGCYLSSIPISWLFLLDLVENLIKEIDRCKSLGLKVQTSSFPLAFISLTMIPTHFMVRIWRLRGRSYGDLILGTLPLLPCIFHRFVAVLQHSSHTGSLCQYDHRFNDIISLGLAQKVRTHLWSIFLSDYIEKAPGHFLRIHIHIPNHAVLSMLWFVLPAHDTFKDL